MLQSDDSSIHVGEEVVVVNVTDTQAVSEPAARVKAEKQYNRKRLTWLGGFHKSFFRQFNSVIMTLRGGGSEDLGCDANNYSV